MWPRTIGADSDWVWSVKRPFRNSGFCFLPLITFDLINNESRSPASMLLLMMHVQLYSDDRRKQGNSYNNYYFLSKTRNRFNRTTSGLFLRSSGVPPIAKRIKKGPVHVHMHRPLRYFSLTCLGEITVESDLRPEIGFIVRHLEEEERFR